MHIIYIIVILISVCVFTYVYVKMTKDKPKDKGPKKYDGPYKIVERGIEKNPYADLSSEEITAVANEYLEYLDKEKRKEEYEEEDKFDED